MSTAPLLERIEGDVPAPATAATVQDQVIGTVLRDGTVQSVSVIPEAAVAADAVNNRTFRLRNRSQAGAGATVVASRQTTTGNGLTAFDEANLTLSATAADLAVVAGDVLVADEVVTGTGQAHGGYHVVVELNR